ncbi:universal stress protein [Sulfitobacter sp.]|uniref:universal stress protein n=1 Tax=Sulfitobacter sp. TaxID=1903071 RepID=UPI003297B784
MKNSTILVILGKDYDTGALEKKLETIRAIPAHAAILVVGETPDYPYYAFSVPMYGGAVFPDEWQEAVISGTQTIKQKAQEIEQLLQKHDVSGDVTHVNCEPARISDAVARRAMLCDMAMVCDDLREPQSMFRQVVYGILFDSPVGVILNTQEPDKALSAQTIFVAWNNHPHSARAIQQALPMLRAAKEVIIGTFDPVMSEYRDGEEPGADVATWLSHHGCTVTVRQFPSGGVEIGTAIMERAKEAGADLVVMGSYGHSRTRQAIFGGTTQTLITQTEQPVFLAH